jgi:phosphatidylglycerol:prolipoprotein diacylglycerol transferase
LHPILFKIGPVAIYSYGFFLATAFLIATRLAIRRAPREGISPEKISVLSIYILFFGILGARTLFVLLNIELFKSKPWWEVFALHHGGLVFYGGLISSILSCLIYLTKNRLSISGTLDLISPYAALGYAIGRIGCFLNGCCWGKQTDLPWGVKFPFLASKVHPTQLYSSLLNFFIFLLLLSVRKRKGYKGEVFVCYLLFYSTGRFFIEFLRGDIPEFMLGLTFTQLISVFLVLVSSAAILQRRLSREKV